MYQRNLANTCEQREKDTLTTDLTWTHAKQEHLQIVQVSWILRASPINNILKIKLTFNLPLYNGVSSSCQEVHIQNHVQKHIRQNNAFIAQTLADINCMTSGQYDNALIELSVNHSINQFKLLSSAQFGTILELSL